MHRLLFLFCALLLLASPLFAQEDVQNDLAAVDTHITTRLDAYGVEQPFATGHILNNGSTAYENISLSANVYSPDDQIVGEGLGYLERACGEALLDYALQPGMQAPFAVPLELYDLEAEAGVVEIVPTGIPTEAVPQIEPVEIPGIVKISDEEVVALEWIDEQTFRFSTGCYRDVFTNRDWFEYSLSSGETTPIEHPRAAEVTGPMREAIELGDPIIYTRSFLSFPPGQRRTVYQTELNTLVSSEPDGTFRRLLYDALFNITLQGINFNKDSGTLMAYYHGGYGDDVLYLLANTDGRQFSQHPINSIPSRIVPGFAANGLGLVIAAEIDGVMGYYLKVPSNEQTIFMFEAEPPGNNWPAPFYEVTADGQRWIFIARPVDGEPRLQCFNRDSAQLHDYTRLPLNLATDERAWLWLSPQNNTMALAANGVNGGLWLIDLTRFETCA